MSVEVLLLIFCVGAAVLALWVDVRFPSIGPSDIWRALIRLVLILALGQLVPHAVGYVIRAGVAPATALLALGLPALVLFFLAMFWLLRALQGMLAGAR